MYKQKHKPTGADVEIDPRSFSTLIDSYRRQKCMALKELQYRVGQALGREVKFSYISEAMRGRHEPVHMADAFAKALEIDADVLLITAGLLPKSVINAIRKNPGDKIETLRNIEKLADLLRWFRDARIYCVGSETRE